MGLVVGCSLIWSLIRGIDDGWDGEGLRWEGCSGALELAFVRGGLFVALARCTRRAVWNGEGQVVMDGGRVAAIVPLP